MTRCRSRFGPFRCGLHRGHLPDGTGENRHRAWTTGAWYVYWNNVPRGQGFILPRWPGKRGWYG